MTERRVAVVTDSTACIPADVMDANSIQVIPQILNWEGQSLLDGVDIKPDAFYARLKTARELPTTSQPAPGQFVDFFSEVAETADGIVGIFISERLSGTLASARTAAAELAGYPIEIVDSRSTAMGLGLMVMKAAQVAARGHGVADVARVARSLVSRVRIVFAVDTLEYLHRGGRIGGAQRMIGSLLSIKPVLHLQDGAIEPLASVRTKRKALNQLVEVVASDTRGAQHVHAAVVNAAATDVADWLCEQVQERLHPDELLQAELSPVIGTHVGPGTVGIAYYAEPDGS